jgi:hypothetical protein
MYVLEKTLRIRLQLCSRSMMSSMPAGLWRPADSSTALSLLRGNFGNRSAPSRVACFKVLLVTLGPLHASAYNTLEV